MRYATLAAALLLTSLSYPSWAQSPADHDAHHPDQKEAPAAKPATPPPGQGGMGASQGMMNMMGGRMPMMDMMQMTGMMRQGGDGMGTIDRVEGRIAFLRTELKITDAQATAWNSFADALRANAKRLGELRTSMMSQPPATGSQGLVDRLATQETWLAARLEGTRAMKSALADLIVTFSDEQKKDADELLAPHMGMMPMIPAMRGGTVGMGQMMQPGKPMQ